MSAAPALAPRLPTSTLIRAAEAGNARVGIAPEDAERVLVSNAFVLGQRQDCPGVERSWCEVCPLVDVCVKQRSQAALG